MCKFWGPGQLNNYIGNLEYRCKKHHMEAHVKLNIVRFYKNNKNNK